MAVLSYHHVTHEVRWMCIFWSPRAQAQFPHCSRFLLNYLGRFLNLRRPYLILPSLCDTGQGAQGLFRVPTCFATPTTSPLKKKWVNMLKYLMVMTFWSASLTSFLLCIIGIIITHLIGTLRGLNEKILEVKSLEWSKCYPPLLGFPFQVTF